MQLDDTDELVLARAQHYGAPEDRVMYYKILGEDRESVNGGNLTWTPGEWVTVEGEIVHCENGLHLCRKQDVLGWLGPTIWKAETRGELVEHDDKVVVREARITEQLTTWNERSARLFAADCAERVLHLFEKERPDDSRVRNAIEVTRRVARGELPVSELAAARGAAMDAARAAARAGWDAARAAARAAGWHAAGGAARAAGAAAGDAGWDAEREWQQARLWEYLDGEV